ncbi:MAG: 50S ribosomal protein L4 [Parcubacteria group bacterium GW2011_GWA2_38_13b]|nr:MAG: 50S ribosomal protein L4 [Parcubacteria group bacterium GW2011_GWA2_38_13b]
MNYPVYNLKNEKIGNIRLSDDIFKVKNNPDLLHQVMVSQMSNARRVLAHTKGRGEVRGGGIKPWRQKGTGRARHGSIRSPIWIGGGITFGPTKERNFSRKIPQKMNKQALRIALSMKAEEKNLKILDILKLENYKTQKMVGLLFELFKGNIEKIRKNSSFVLILLGKNDYSKNIARASRNIPYVKTIRNANLNVLDVMSYKQILLDKESLDVIKNNLEKNVSAESFPKGEGK